MFRRGCHDTTLIQVARRYIGNRRVPACMPMASHAKDCHISRRQSRTEDSWTLAGDEKLGRRCAMAPWRRRRPTDVLRIPVVASLLAGPLLGTQKSRQHLPVACILPKCCSVTDGSDLTHHLVPHTSRQPQSRRWPLHRGCEPGTQCKL